MSNDQGTSAEPTPAEVEEYPVDRLRRRLTRRMGGRPLMVYVVLFAGAVTLLLLLGVVWISATNNGDGDEEICTEIAPAEAQAEVLGGQVRRIRALVDQDQPVQTLTGLVLQFVDDTCRQTRMGADLRPALFGVLGAAELYNEFNDDTGVDITYQEQDIQRELLATSTPVPTEPPPTVPASPTVAPTETPVPSTATRPAAVSPARTVTIGTGEATPRPAATP